MVSETRYSPACDVFALGVVFYVLLSGHMPFSKNNPGKMLSGQFSFPDAQFALVSQVRVRSLCLALRLVAPFFFGLADARLSTARPNLK